MGAIGWVILTMTIVILAYDQLLFRPLVAWADKFRMETTSSGIAPESWLLDLVRRTHLIHRLLVPAGWLFATAARVPLRLPSFCQRVVRPYLRHDEAGQNAVACRRYRSGASWSLQSRFMWCGAWSLTCAPAWISLRLAMCSCWV